MALSPYRSTKLIRLVNAPPLGTVLRAVQLGDRSQAKLVGRVVGVRNQPARSGLESEPERVDDRVPAVTEFSQRALQKA